MLDYLVTYERSESQYFLVTFFYILGVDSERSERYNSLEEI